MKDIFVSYRPSHDSHAAGRLCAELERTLVDHAMFIDVADIQTGADFIQSVAQNARSCRALVTVIGPTWLDARDDDGERHLDDRRDFVRVAVATALTRKIPVIPVLLDGTKTPTAASLPADIRSLASLQPFEISHRRFREDVKTLAKALETILARPRRPFLISGIRSPIDNSAYLETLDIAFENKRVEIIQSTNKEGIVDIEGTIEAVSEVEAWEGIADFGKKIKILLGMTVVMATIGGSPIRVIADRSE